LPDTTHCDYLVIGGGAAGCIVARRLAECSSNRVILLEAGKVDEGDPIATDLSRLEEQDDSYDWGYRARPLANSTQQIFYNRAKMLGGCANHNDCAFLVPPASDFERWVELGATGWDYAANKSAFERIEQRLHIDTVSGKQHESNKNRQQGHLPLYKVGHLRGLVDQYHAKPHQGVGTADGNTAEHHL
jgi:choline dehydrogenase-like flavoprotein